MCTNITQREGELAGDETVGMVSGGAGGVCGVGVRVSCFGDGSGGTVTMLMEKIVRSLW